MGKGKTKNGNKTNKPTRSASKILLNVNFENDSKFFSLFFFI